jgi:hypothetical protein
VPPCAGRELTAYLAEIRATRAVDAAAAVLGRRGMRA